MILIQIINISTIFWINLIKHKIIWLLEKRELHYFFLVRRDYTCMDLDGSDPTEYLYGPGRWETQLDNHDDVIWLPRRGGKWLEPWDMAYPHDSKSSVRHMMRNTFCSPLKMTILKKDCHKIVAHWKWKSSKSISQNKIWYSSKLLLNNFSRSSYLTSGVSIQQK